MTAGALTLLRMATLGMACALGMCVARATDDDNVLNVYNFSTYIGEDTVRNFEKETGIRVTYDTYDENEVLYAKLRAGHTGYDVVMPGSQWANRLIAGHLLHKLDKSRITTLGNVDPQIMKELIAAGGDASGDYIVPWLWGIGTVGMNVDKVKAALGDLPMPADPWDLLFKPEYSTRIKRCGISLVDASESVFAAALHYLKRPISTDRAADYSAAAELLARLRPNVALFSSGSYVDDLASGRLCLVYGYSGDISTAGKRARDAKVSQSIVATVPPSGALTYFDGMAIPADARHMENAYRWMSYVYRPDVQAGIVSSVFHSSAVPTSRALLTDEVRNTPALFLTPAQMALMEPPRPVPERIVRLRTRLFASFKSGL